LRACAQASDGMSKRAKMRKLEIFMTRLLSAEKCRNANQAIK
jgi:hypothetical protein